MLKMKMFKCKNFYLDLWAKSYIIRQVIITDVRFRTSACYSHRRFTRDVGFFMEVIGMGDKVAIFIDGAYVDNVLKDHFYSKRIDYDKLPKELAKTHGVQILRTYYYDCPPHQSNPPSEDEKRRKRSKDRFFAQLNRLNHFEVRKGRVACKKVDGRSVYQQKRTDVMLAIDMVQLSATHQISTAILIAGDNDFTPVVNNVKNNAVSVVLYHGPHRTYNNELWNACDDRYEIDKELVDKTRLF